MATYNIHRCIGRDGRFDPDRIVEVLRQLDVDVVALQEVESVRDAGLDILDRFARETGMRAIAGPTMTRPDADYGNAVLSRLTIERIARIDLSEPCREARGALHIRFSAPCHLSLLATHLGLKRGERNRQARRLCQSIAGEAPSTEVIAGDLNEWIPFGASMRRLRRRFGPSPFLPTFPAHMPLLSLDRIMVSPPQRLRALRRHRSPLTRIASDHLPLVAEIDCGEHAVERKAGPAKT